MDEQIGRMPSPGADEGAPSTESLTPDKRPQDGLALYAKRKALEAAAIPDDPGPTADEWASTDDEDDEKAVDKGRAASRGAADAAPSASGEALVPVEGFEAAASFLGAREGKCFKLGPAGIGYYPNCVPDSSSLEELMQSQAAEEPPGQEDYGWEEDEDRYERQWEEYKAGQRLERMWA